ncbi:hypothetical protein WM40_05935 [Robbsia andropogonis]|uniref:Uncharacterized protein n=1 Tax=Robbsia andropogonis TaxID=28092 RepID=A0A0F5K4H4_9BURK|nr:cytochrome oxidase putative small subunit CydP [Robbsia andropogonis]KKB64442.1 hypothetical protein WM40_05935 [Robbsia andropogonis]MCP1118984.1 hypothetical protein [Robbsia andropogonis]MCP1128664.1 hypothetical protein [Robbsia andropogonis]
MKPTARLAISVASTKDKARTLLRRQGLMRDVVIVLVIKLVLIQILRVTCFAHPAAPDMNMPDDVVAAAIIGPVPSLPAGLPTRVALPAPRGKPAQQDVDHDQP